MGSDAVLFIDANKYLDLYQVNSCKKLLGPLASLADHILVTEQVVFEVQRNRNQIAALFLTQKYEALKLRTIGLPDNHSSGEQELARKQLHADMRAISDSVDTINKRIDDLKHASFKSICLSEDEVSKTLAGLFSNAVKCSDDELQRARLRRERGNPPGKASDALGDQLTWEQILSRLPGKKSLWIITRDGDYLARLDGQVFLNHLLSVEVNSASPGIAIHVFTDLGAGLTHFMTNTKPTGAESLQPEDAAEIQKEEEELQEIDSMSIPADSWRENEWLKRNVYSAANSIFAATLGFGLNSGFDTLSFAQAIVKRFEEQKKTAASEASRMMDSYQSSINVAKGLVEQQKTAASEASRIMDSYKPPNDVAK